MHRRSARRPHETPRLGRRRYRRGTACLVPSRWRSACRPMRRHRRTHRHRPAPRAPTRLPCPRIPCPRPPRPRTPRHRLRLGPRMSPDRPGSPAPTVRRLSRVGIRERGLRRASRPRIPDGSSGHQNAGTATRPKCRSPSCCRSRRTRSRTKRSRTTRRRTTPLARPHGRVGLLGTAAGQPRRPCTRPQRPRHPRSPPARSGTTQRERRIPYAPGGDRRAASAWPGVTVGAPWSEGGLCAVARDPRTGALTAAANPRGMQGYAVGR